MDRDGEQFCCQPEGRAAQADLKNNLTQFRRQLGLGESGPVAPSGLPFAGADVTAGAENELQSVVIGDRQDIDLAIVIEQSNFFRNLRQRARAGESSQRVVADLEGFLAGNSERVWENSWLRFPRRCLNSYADRVFQQDLRVDKSRPDSPLRDDAHRFFFLKDRTSWVRIPASYLLKVALADVIGAEGNEPLLIRKTGERILGHFLNDNTSTETFSFHVVGSTDGERPGAGLVKETAKRFLLTQLLVEYANQKFELAANGQQAMIYFSPHPPVRQKRLNDLVSDAFYRELFISPCLSGWDRGQEKHRYMKLCHQTLSRSQLNAALKLREAGIITRNLIALPNTSNISLANNGTHISLGSRKLTAMLAADQGGQSAPAREKYFGDLVIKIVEHFLPLFVGIYSAAPYRLDFRDFHPERALGFLPHELDSMHLRMIWRRWKKKARLKIFGQPLTPFGPEMFDRAASRIFGLRGDFIPDFRMIDYLVALLSVEQSPALDGRPGNTERLKQDLAEFGIFDRRMPMYLLYRLREYGQMGFSGFEGRHYSLFETFTDMAAATDLQALITAFAYKLVLNGRVGHGHMPDDPVTESERRQTIFVGAIDLPTFFVQSATKNMFLRGILARTENMRASRRYKGFTRVRFADYRLALLRTLREEAGDLIEYMGMGDTLAGLEKTLRSPAEHGVGGRLTKRILQETRKKSPLDMDAEQFNAAAEKYYRTTLKRKQTAEAFSLFEQELDALLHHNRSSGFYRKAAASVGVYNGASFLHHAGQEFLAGKAALPVVRQLIQLVLISLHANLQSDEKKRADS